MQKPWELSLPKIKNFQNRGSCIADAAQGSFPFLGSVTVEGEEVRGDYKITGNEYFLEGHFKDQAIFPASIMIEALGQLCVFYLLKGDHPGLTEKVDPKTIFFTSCDGVKCRRICQPGDKLSMKVRVSRVRHPLACFSGEINVGGEKTATAEIKLAFDYFPVVDVQADRSPIEVGQIHANGKTDENGKPSQSSPRFVKYNG